VTLLARQAGAVRGWEHRREREEQVEQNLSPDEVAVWRRERHRFKGTPHQRFEKFRDWLHDHPEALRGHLEAHGAARAKSLVREYETAPHVTVPCRDPWRFRTYAACNPTGRKQARWTKSRLIGAGRAMEVPCEAPYRFRVKELCKPRARKDAWVAPWEKEEPAHAFEGLI